ncbi:ankyrin repeat-containing protein [Legionella steigerwaltii]|uniref:Ankyrin repeat-containing protein n=1 Tax=Legionella steigerwaltii TaxID=460 RepID=A0A378LAY1_9GAMM|nr:Fic family protein [Legionella steigerwaltii]KTD71170.1 ankyrin repeat-containing protein [Legionella steigerwaltii]STY23874.1 ankyrin repeat-containing protein [Legionella steigerwaltii]
MDNKCAQILLPKLMKISSLYQSKLNNFKSTPKLETPLRLIARGIHYEHISGEEAELREFILDHIADPTDIEAINQPDNDQGCTVIAELFGILPRSILEQSEENKRNILLAFRIFFEKNPLSLIKSIQQKTEHGDTVWTSSALEKIAEAPELLQEFIPELSLFISKYATKLSELELRRLVAAIHGNQVLMGLVMELYAAGQFNLPHFQRNTLSEEELAHSLKIYWHPEQKGNVAYFYQDFPELELWRLFMDGYQQEAGWSNYDAREKGCINQLYQAWLYTKNTMTEPLTPEYFKKIHSICAKGIIWNNTEGMYRKYGASFALSTRTLTFLGYIEHLTQFNNLCTLERRGPLGFDAITSIETERLDTVIKEIIEEYESTVCTHAEKPEDLLYDIIIFCKKLELIHPFNDCNGRLFCNLLLNRELVRHGFSPTILDNPNMIEGFTIKEFMSEVIRGMNSFQRLKTDGLFNNGMKTIDLIKTQIYPIPDVWNRYQLSQSIPQNTTPLLGKQGIFAASSEKQVCVSSETLSHGI